MHRSTGPVSYTHLDVYKRQVLLIAGRIIQGLSAACIMPSTIALMNAYFEGNARQRALSFWSIGARGGGGIASFAGGAIAVSYTHLIPSAPMLITRR